MQYKRGVCSIKFLSDLDAKIEDLNTKIENSKSFK